MVGVKCVTERVKAGTKVLIVVIVLFFIQTNLNLCFGNGDVAGSDHPRSGTVACDV